MKELRLHYFGTAAALASGDSSCKHERRDSRPAVSAAITITLIAAATAVTNASPAPAPTRTTTTVPATALVLPFYCPATPVTRAGPATTPVLFERVYCKIRNMWTSLCLSTAPVIS